MTLSALLAVSLAMMGIGNHTTAAEATCSKFLNVFIADPGSPSPVELGQVLTVVRTAIAEQHAKNADAFPAQSEGVVGMMKGGGLKTVGYSKHDHANEPKTFPDCLDACHDNCKCLGFHWSDKLARCGLKAEGNIPVSVDNRYQKTFRSFKRLEVMDCTPATTTAATTTPATTTSTTTSTTTAEPTTTVYCSYTNSTTTFKQGVERYFADGTNECAINTFDASAVTDMRELLLFKATFNQNISNWATGAVTSMFGMFNGAAAFNQNMNNWATGAVTTMQQMFFEAAAFNQNINGFNTGAVATMQHMFSGAVAFNQTINNWNTSAVTAMGLMFLEAAAFNQNINNWATDAVTAMFGMFSGATAFNQNINNWATGAVTTMEGMFNAAAAFSQNISNWATGAVTTMKDMFYDAAAFNQTINNWNTSAVTANEQMFAGTLMTDAQKPTFNAGS